MASKRVAKYEVSVSYMKCLRNHATKSMAIVLDGCCEFAPGGIEETPNFLFCAACGCHRNFHKRKESLIPSFEEVVEYQLINDNSPVVAFPAPSQTVLPPIDENERDKEMNTRDKEMKTRVAKEVRPQINPEQNEILKAFADRVDENERGKEMNTGDKEMKTRVAKKVRTQINPEQKEILKAFAERNGWRFRNCEKEEVMEVCTEVGIGRSTLKNWMNNNRKKMMPRASQQLIVAKPSRSNLPEI